MKRMLFNATQAEELRVAIVDGQKLVDLDIETVGKEQRKGNIYKGIITRIEPSLEACFVDYGTERHGFLPFKEVSRSYFQGYDGGRPRIQDVLREGMEVVVQVEKDERGNKGAALTTYISLAGRYLVLMPNNPRGGGVSRRIEGEERQELKDLLAQLEVPNGMSLIARTAGIGRNLEELQWDMGYLMQLWRAIEGAAGSQNAPFLILQEGSLVIRAIRDYYHPDIGEILIDTDEIYEQARQFMSHVMPNMVHRVKLYKDHVPLFSRFQIEHQIETAFSRSVQLPSGGAIVIDHTEALVSIDVNSARSTKGADIEETALRTNVEAAEEIARQLRLRDLGGLIVIDFIDMENPKNQREVENKLRDVLKHDRARVQMGKLSRFGLLELSRQRLQPSLGETSHEPCPRCHGIGFIRGAESSALHILRIIQEEAMKENTGAVHAQVPVDVATFLLNEKRAEIHSIEERLDVDVVLIPNIHLETPHYKIARIRHDDLAELGDSPSYLRVEVQEEDIITNFGQEKPKVERQEAAVKGITPQQPAPVSSQPEVAAAAAPVEAEQGVVGRFFGWVKSLFAEPEEQPKETEKKKPAAASNSRDGQRNGNRQRGNERRPGSQARRDHNERRHGEDAGKRPTEARQDGERQDGRRQPQRNERADRQERPERVERAERAERAERPERAERSERAERGEQPQREPRQRREREPRENREPREQNARPQAEERNEQAAPQAAEKPSRRRQPQSERNEADKPLVNAAEELKLNGAEGVDAAAESAEQQERGERGRRRRGRRDRRREPLDGENTATLGESGEVVAAAAAGFVAVEAASVLEAAPQPEAVKPVEQVAEAVASEPVVQPAVEPVAAEVAVAAEPLAEVEPPVAAEAAAVVVEQPVLEPAPARVVEVSAEAPVAVAAAEAVLEQVSTVIEAQPLSIEPAVAAVAEVAVVAEPVAAEPVVAVLEPVAEVVAAPVVEVPAAPVVSAVETKPEAPADLGGLVMVATKAAVQQEQPQVEVPAGPRRRDVVRQAAEQAAPAEVMLQQVETRNN
ncbi:Rne/Rng family ribonuclease [Aquitalea aquatica]|uniref:Ribonuclease E n=1 Tax=Aquitalea aquatica TaxID=3044273 RepID=A0A838YIZ6_9NEIS|nr:Rne/Rng family ribonuclease [Aquitalea magnusonii]MBA4710714.1 Rne/Rng family ribonuclease [Aquitalea magnusonii]